MNSKLTRTILLALTLGFFVVWVLEFRRAGLFESYWLLLLSIMSLLLFQFLRLKASVESGKINRVEKQLPGAQLPGAHLPGAQLKKPATRKTAKKS